MVVFRWFYPHVVVFQVHSVPAVQCLHPAVQGSVRVPAEGSAAPSTVRREHGRHESMLLNSPSSPTGFNSPIITHWTRVCTFLLEGIRLPLNIVAELTLHHQQLDPRPPCVFVHPPAVSHQSMKLNTSLSHHPFGPSFSRARNLSESPAGSLSVTSGHSAFILSHL